MMNNCHELIVVEDDRRLSLLMQQYLQEENFNVECFSHGEGAIEAIVQQQPNAVILDIMLPDVDGVEVCRRIRKSYFSPIIMLTAADNDFAEITALNCGADKFLLKPIKPQVLLAHLNAMLRRVDVQPKPLGERGHDEASTINIHSSRREVLLENKMLELGSFEYELLEFFTVNAGRPISRYEIYKSLKGIEYDGFDRHVDLTVSSLRKKIGDDNNPYKIIKTLRNKGYLLCPNAIQMQL